MIPTFFGITFVVWLVMALAPGRSGEQATGNRDESMSKDPNKAAQENEAQRTFRRQFGLDRPMFWNDWVSLGADEVGEDLRLAFGDIEDVGADNKRKAKERLEDYGLYAVPPLIDLLQRTSGDEQNQVRYWLGRSAVRLVIKRPGKKLTDTEIKQFREWRVENRKFAKWTWKESAPADERAPIVKSWADWFASNKGRWEYDTGEYYKRLFTDTQFGTYWGRLVKGDLGVSVLHKRPVWELIRHRMKYSLSLNLVAFLLIYLFAVPTGVWAAVHNGTTKERVVAVLLFALYSLPNYFVGTLLIKWFATGDPFKWFPQGSFEADDAAQMNTWTHFKDVLWHITLPLMCLTYGGLATLSRFARSGMLDVIRSDYVRTARAKGLREWNVILKHVVRNGILPVVTLLGTSLPVLISGSVAIEYIFEIDGMGKLMLDSITNKDFNVVMGVQLIVGVLTMVGILLSDIAYALLDPRISLQ